MYNNNKILILLVLALFGSYVLGIKQISNHRNVKLHNNNNINTKNAIWFHEDDKHLERQKRFSDSENDEHTYLLHVGKPLSAKEKNQLENFLEIKLDVYIPENTYLLIADYKTAEKAVLSPLVKWVGEYKPEYKISHDLYESLKTHDTIKVILSPKQGRSLSQAQNIATLWSGLINKEDIVSVQAVASNMITITFQPKSQNKKQIIEMISERPESHFIETQRVLSSLNHFANQVIQSNSNPAYPLPFMTNTSLFGQGQIVGLADSGVTYGSCYFTNASDPVTFAKDVTNLNAPKLIRYDTTFSGGDATDGSGHGTSIAGTILGYNNMADNANGIAPFARLHFSDIQNANGPLATISNYSALMSKAYDDGARIFVLPFGSEGVGYRAEAQQIDLYTRNKLNMLVIVSSGNDQSLTSLAYSKNALVVGSSMSSNDGMLNGLPGSQALTVFGNPGLYGSHVLSNFSGRGPTADGRIKPDITAPGQNIETAVKTGICTSAKLNKGTSFAAAVAAGAATLVRNYFANGFFPDGTPDGDQSYTDPPASLVKAIIINSGQQLLLTDQNGKGHYVGLTEYPSGMQGFGRIQLDKTLFIKYSNTTSQNLFVFPSQAEAGLTTGKGARGCYKVGKGGYLKATLVYTDPEADVAAGHILINDLDLVVIDNIGVEYRTATADGDFDSYNNVEQVMIENSGADQVYAVHVHGRSVPVSPQTYHVVISGSLITNVECGSEFGNFCPADCSGPLNGVCSEGFCVCNRTNQGIDCSLTPCPVAAGKICAGNGICDYDTSTCKCTGTWGGNDCASTIPPTPPPQANNQTIIVNTKNGFSSGVLAGGIIAAFFIGAIISIFLGGYLAVRYLEYRRDKAMRERASRDEEMK